MNVRKRTVQDYDVWTFERAHNFRGRLRRFFGIQNILSVVSAYDDIKIIICYNFRSVPFLRVIAYCRKNGIKVISNTTEWYGKTGRNVVFDFLGISIRFFECMLPIDMSTANCYKQFSKGFLRKCECGGSSISF